jgi:DNA-binding beta-propeller fold protein YncE
VRTALIALLVVLLGGCGTAARSPARSSASAEASGGSSVVPESPASSVAQTALPLPSGHPAAALFVVGAEGAPPCGIASDGRLVWFADFRRSRIAVIDPATDTVVARQIVNGGPCGMTYLDGSLFIAERTGKFLYQRDAATFAEIGEPVLGGGTIWDVAAGSSSIWFTDRGHGELVEVDAATNQLIRRVEIGGELSGLAVTATAVWVAAESTDETVRVDPASGEIVARLATGVQPVWVAATDALAWITHADGTAVLIDAASNEQLARLDLGGQPGEPAIAGDAVWIPNQASGSIIEVGLADGVGRRTLTIGPGVAQVAAGAGGLWVSGYTDGRVWRVVP